MKRLKRFGRWLISPFALWTFAAVLTSLFFWFIAPSIALGDVYPFGSLVIRLWILLLIVLTWAIINLVVQRRRASKEQSLLQALRRQEEEAAAAKDQAAELIATEVTAIKTRIERAVGPLRWGKPWMRRWRRSDDLPWLLLIGPAGAGKTTAVLTAGLTMPFAVTADANTPTATCDAIVTNRAVFLDIAGRYITQDTDPRMQGAVWHGVLDWLRKNRPRQPLNGIVLTVSALEIAAMPAEERHALAQTIRRRLDEIGERLRTRVPVYVVLSKLDLLAGFRETFEVLSHEDAAQVWGLPLAPLGSASTAATTTQQFRAGFGDLVQRIAKRELKRLQDETDEHSRSLIFAFPQQLAALEAGLADFFEVIGGSHEFGVPPLIRGVAMISARQGDAPLDLLAGPMRRTFLSTELQRTAGPARRAGLRSRSFFLRHFFQEVLVAETSGTGLSRPALVREKIQSRAAAVLLATAFVGALLLFWFSYRESDLYLTRVMAATEQARVRLDGFGLQGRALPPFGQTLSILDALRDLSDAAENLTSARVFQVGVVEDNAQAAYRRGLDNLLVPYVMRSLETSITDRTVLVATRFQQLKLYLMLGGERSLDPALLSSLTPAFGAALLRREDPPQARSSLLTHLIALGDPAPPASALDLAKVREARQLIAEVTLAKIAYDLVRDEVASRNIPPWRPGDNMGSAGARAIALASGASVWDGLSALYTRTGYLSTLTPVARRMSDAIAADAWVLGPAQSESTQFQQSARIAAGVFDLYRADYIRVWDSLLSDLSVVPLQTPSQAAEVLAILIGSPSPLKQILDAIAEQTNFDLTQQAGLLAGAASAVVTSPLLGGIPGPPRDPISVHFAPMRNAVRAPEGKESQIDGVLKVVEALYRQLNHLATGGDIIELGAEPQQVLNQANDLIGRLPPSLQPVFTRIRKEASAVAEGRSRDRLKGIWATTVLPACQTATRGKYPFDQSATPDLTLADFTRLFAPEGAIAGFRKTYLKSYLDTTERPWKWRTARNIDLQLSDDTLKRFEQADAITSAFFEGDKPVARYTIEFTSLDRKADAAQFDVGGVVASYAHGPVTPVAAVWPPAAETPVTLSVTPEISGSTNAIVGDGPWGLFRVMQKARITIAGPRATARFMLGNRETSMVLNAASPRHPFEAGLLTNFRCPVF